MGEIYCTHAPLAQLSFEVVARIYDFTDHEFLRRYVLIEIRPLVIP